ncbi:MAG: MFS transporter, partial [Bdellovibrionales bacterium]|nr:MFS transporter [Bdellovibrionales bacterium]
ILSSEELSRGNGFIQFWTFIAIIGGTAVGGMLAASLEVNPYLPGAVLFATAVLGLFSSVFITRTPAANPQKQIALNPFTVFSSLQALRRDRGLFLCLLAISYFWAVGSLYQLNLALYAKQLGGWDDVPTALLMAALGIGIGAGSLTAGKVSEGKVELGLVPIGAVGMSLFGSVLAFTYSSYALTVGVLIALGVAAGFYVVPLNAYLQENSPADRRGDFIAATNFVSFSSMLLSSFLLWLLVDGFGMGPDGVFLLMGATALLAGVYICTVLPEVLLRCINWLLVHVLYRLKVVGAHRVPKEGGALLVANHLSFIDAPLLLASLRRPVRFLMYKPIYEARLIHPFAKLAGAIPVEGGSRRNDVQHALASATEAIARGELVCIFAEGAISRIGRLLKFKKGLERIMEESDAPIIPVHLDRVWGSIFSFRGGKFFFKWPEMIPYPVTVSFGEPLPSSTPSYRVRQSVEELSADAYALRRDVFQVLSSGFLASCKRRFFKHAVRDHGGAWLRGGTLGGASLWLARKLRTAHEERMVGVYLPPSVGAAMANASLLLAGKVPVNLNYTAGPESLRSAIAQCGIKRIVTAKRFLDKVPLDIDSGLEHIHLDDSQWKPPAVSVLWWAVLLAVLPKKLLLWNTGGSGSAEQDTATVIFSSGSTGEPKGVELTHANISANISAIHEMFGFGHDDCVVGVLPFFHSFGFTGALWLPLLAGFRAVYHPNPLDAAAIGRMAAESGATLLISTPTFLQTYIRKVKPEQFASLRNVFVGAEKLRGQVRDAFSERFGVVPREGYGCTELSPVAIANIEDFGSGRELQIGTKEGSVGRPIPGVTARVVDLETGEPLGPRTEGLLLIRGANVMRGYLGKPELTAAVIKDGWYHTGDVARFDEDGFITITDRLSRFSKIGGEMVPHVKIEEEIHRLLGTTESICAVTAVADERKGERLIVLCVQELDSAEVSRGLAEAGLPNLWIPRAENYHRIDALPLLGSGKLDLKQVKVLAEALSNAG